MLDNLEVKVLCSDVLPRIDIEVELTVLRLEDIQVGAVVIVVILDACAVRLRSPGGESKTEFVVFQNRERSLSVVGLSESAVLEHLG